jgi:hypothetical protein
MAKVIGQIEKMGGKCSEPWELWTVKRCSFLRQKFSCFSASFISSLLASCSQLQSCTIGRGAKGAVSWTLASLALGLKIRFINRGKIHGKASVFKNISI